MMRELIDAARDLLEARIPDMVDEVLSLSLKNEEDVAIWRRSVSVL